MNTPTPAVPATPLPPQTASPMAAVGKPAAAHLGPPQGIPSGPSAAELMLVIQQMQEQINLLMGAGVGANQLRSVEATPEPVEKIYFHQTPGSNIVVTRRGPRGEHIPETVFFDFRGSLVTSDPVVQEFLDEISDRPGVPVYTHKAPHVNADAATAASQVIQSAARTIDKLGSEARPQA